MAIRRVRASLDADSAGVVHGGTDALSEGGAPGVAEAASRLGRRNEMLDALADFEQEQGAITKKELAASRRRLGLSGPGRSPSHKSG